MKKLKKYFTLGLAAVLLACLLSQNALSAKTSKVVVVVKSDGSLTDLTLKDIKAIYTGEKLYMGSSKIEPLFNGNNDVAGIFLKKVLDKTKAQYKKIWNSKAFVDALVAPATLPDSSDILRVIYKNESAIGFVEEDEINPSQKKYLKILCAVE